METVSADRLPSTRSFPRASNLIYITDVLTPDEMKEIRIQIGRGRFVDGRWTAGGPAADVKHNRILDAPDDRIDQIAVNALVRHPLFDAYAIPWRFAPPQVAKFEPGMYYGSHVDAALMGKTPRMRCDLSATIFLSEPGDYRGGDLTITYEGGETSTKLPAGSAVVYSADTLHRVAPVEHGERLVIVTWVQSHVRDYQIRGMLFDLAQVIDRLRSRNHDRDDLLRLVKTHANLYRKFAET